jgi:hypothetical protein
VASNPQPGIEIRSNRLEAYGVRDEKEACRVQIGHFMGKLTPSAVRAGEATQA